MGGYTRKKRSYKGCVHVKLRNNLVGKSHRINVKFATIWSSREPLKVPQRRNAVIGNCHQENIVVILFDGITSVVNDPWVEDCSFRDKLFRLFQIVVHPVGKEIASGQCGTPLYVRKANLSVVDGSAKDREIFTRSSEVVYHNISICPHGLWENVH